MAALEQRLGRPIHVSRFCHLAGAIGAALELADAGVCDTCFRGLSLWRKTIPTRVEILPAVRQSLQDHRSRPRRRAGGQRVFVRPGLCRLITGEPQPVRVQPLKERQKAFVLPEPRPGFSGPTLGLPSTLHLADDQEFWQVFFGALSVPTITRERLRDAVPSGNAGAEFCAPMAGAPLHADVLNQGLIRFIERHGGEVVTLPYSGIQNEFPT